MITKSTLATNILLLALLSAASPLSLSAQTASEVPKADASAAPQTPRPDPSSWPVHTFYLKNSTGQATLNDDVTVLRNMTTQRGSEFYPVSSQNAIVARVSPADLPKVERILSDIDLPEKTYRITYTLNEMDGTKRIGTQHFAIVMVSGQQTTLKQGSKVPAVTGSFGSGSNSGLGVQTQFTYLNVDINIDGTLQGMGTVGALRYSIDQASIAPETSTTGSTQQPIVRQTTLRGEVILTPGRPLLLGSLDFPGSTRRIDVEALMEPLP